MSWPEAFFYTAGLVCMTVIICWGLTLLRVG